MSQDLISSIRCIENRDDVTIGVHAHMPTQHLAHRADTLFPAASIIKLAIALSIHALSVKQRAIADYHVHIDSSDAHCGSGTLTKRVGASYTVNQLIWHLLAQSDNTAQNALVRTLPSLEIQSFINQKLHLHNTRYVPLPETTSSHYSTTTPEDAVALINAINKLQQHNDVVTHTIRDALSRCAQEQLALTTAHTTLLKHGALPTVQHYVFSCYANGHTHTIAILARSTHGALHVTARTAVLALTKEIITHISDA